MTRTATGTTLAILDKLEPEAKAGWEAEELNLTEAIACSAAITSRATAQAQADAQTIRLTELRINDEPVYNATAGSVRERYPDAAIP